MSVSSKPGWSSSSRQTPLAKSKGARNTTLPAVCMAPLPIEPIPNDPHIGFAYAHAVGMNSKEFLARFGAPMPPRVFREKIVSVLNNPKYAEGFALRLKGAGVTMLEGAAP